MKTIMTAKELRDIPRLRTILTEGGTVEVTYRGKPIGVILPLPECAKPFRSLKDFRAERKKLKVPLSRLVGEERDDR